MQARGHNVTESWLAGLAQLPVWPMWWFSRRLLENRVRIDADPFYVRFRTIIGEAVIDGLMEDLAH
jgi:hypothetical protein